MLTFPSVVVASHPDDFLSGAVDVSSSVSGDCVDSHLFFFMAIKTGYFSRDAGRSPSASVAVTTMIFSDP